ncbi:MAG: hypothetical protein EBW84_01305, partial [Betaproteobacteria bacterium]|nr:hypothetical protein [Betaproteobacteria bacterium]
MDQSLPVLVIRSQHTGTEYVRPNSPPLSVTVRLILAEKPDVTFWHALSVAPENDTDRMTLPELYDAENELMRAIEPGSSVHPLEHDSGSSQGVSTRHDASGVQQSSLQQQDDASVVTMRPPLTAIRPLMTSIF